MWAQRCKSFTSIEATPRTVPAFAGMTCHDGTFLRCPDYFPATTGRKPDAKEIFQGRVQKRRARDEEAQEGNVEERPLWQEGQEPQTGDRDRTFRGAQVRQEGPEKEDRQKEDRQKGRPEIKTQIVEEEVAVS